MMDLNSLLGEKRINSEKCLVLRHRPQESELRKRLHWLAAERPEVFNAYQQTQSERVERQMKRAEHVASFIGHQPGFAVFVGLYEVKGWNWMTKKEVLALATYRALREFGQQSTEWGRNRLLFFDLRLSHIFAEWKGKLIVRWPPPEIVFSRWASANRFEVEAILQESLLAKDMPDWRDLLLSWEDLHAIPASWRYALQQWRGVYFILDSQSGQGYVGSAYGKDNMYQRWTNYAKTGHGGNKLLRQCEPRNLRFSILERVSPDTPDQDVIERERTWKVRLHTRQHGLNAN